MVFDREAVFIGSFNLDPRSAVINTEAGLYIESPELAERLVAYMATCAALPVMRGRTELPRPSFSAPAGLLIPAGAIALGVWLISNSPWAEVRVAVIFACVGILLYFVGARETRTVTAPVLSSPASD